MRIIYAWCTIFMSCHLVGEVQSINCITNNGIVYRCLNRNIVEAVGRVDSLDNGDLLIPSGVLGWRVRGVGDSAFAGDRSLRSVRLEQGVWKVGSRAFRGCSGIVKVELPDCLSVLGDEAFAGCLNIKEVRLPDGLDYGGSSVFKGCDSLCRLVIADGLSCNIVPMFYGCAGLCEFEVGKNKLYRVVDGCLYDSSGRVFVRCPATFPGSEVSVRDGVMGIADCAFLGCKKVKTVRLPRSLEEIGSAAFGSSGIESVELPEGVSYIGMEAFGGCANLHSVVIPRSVQYIGMYCFGASKELRRIVFKGGRPKIVDSEYSIEAKDCVLMVPKGSSGWDGKEHLWGLSVRFYDELLENSRLDKTETR